MQRYPIPAVQYLRMSTELQQYSIENQSSAIKAYANRMGFSIIKSYIDRGRSGVLFKNRPALSQLLQEVLDKETCFKAILVYDVSRWGRFQDADEAAHYEFLCKRAGIRVHYCSETFSNDNSLTTCVMKALKRAMAAEFSRELGDRVFAAEKRWAEAGFKQGGPAGYALARVMISPDGKRRQFLRKGEVKCLQSDRVILIPGDKEEVACVREIYRLVVDERRTPFEIARELSERGLTQRGRRWSHQNVYRILTNPKYAGCNVWNRSRRRLGEPNITLPRAQWIIKPGAFEPVVDPLLFQEAQQVLSLRTCEKSNEKILDELRVLLAQRGRLTAEILQQTAAVPSVAACKKRFGSLQRAFKLAGYSVPARYSRRPSSVGDTYDVVH